MCNFWNGILFEYKKRANEYSIVPTNFRLNVVVVVGSVVQYIYGRRDVVSKMETDIVSPKNWSLLGDKSKGAAILCPVIL